MSSTKKKKTKKKTEVKEDFIDVFMFTDMPYPGRQMTIYGLIHKEKDGRSDSRR